MLKEDVFYPLKKGEYIKAHYDFSLNNQSVQKGEKAGKAYYYLNDNLVKNVNLFYKHYN